MDNIVNQHDKYFKEIFSRKEEMSDFITNALPQIDQATEKLRQISNRGGEIAETIAQKLEKKGHVKGLEEGFEKGIKQVAKMMIREGFNNEAISKCTNFSIKQIELMRDLEEINADI
jgi:predicted transposase YdaD